MCWSCIHEFFYLMIVTILASAFLRVGSDHSDRFVGLDVHLLKDIVYSGGPGTIFSAVCGCQSNLSFPKISS